MLGEVVEGGACLGRSQCSRREGQEMKLDFFFKKGKHYVARPVNPKGDYKELKIYCSQSFGLHYEKEKPVFNNGNRMVNIIELKTVGQDGLSVQRAVIRIYINHDWSEDFEVLAIPFEMPDFEYENK